MSAQEACCKQYILVTEPSLLADGVLEVAGSQQAPSSCDWWLPPFHLPLAAPWGTLCVEVSPAYLNYSRMGCRSVGKPMALRAQMSVLLGLGSKANRRTLAC